MSVDIYTHNRQRYRKLYFGYQGDNFAIRANMMQRTKADLGPVQTKRYIDPKLECIAIDLDYVFHFQLIWL